MKNGAYIVPEICTLYRQLRNRSSETLLHSLRINRFSRRQPWQRRDGNPFINWSRLYVAFFTGEPRRGELGNDPMTSKCSLGRVLSGPISTTKKQSLSNINFESAHVLKFAREWQDSPLEEMLHRLWDIESNGIKDKGTVHESFLRNVTFEGGRYTVSLPLQERHELLPDNHDLSLAKP